MTDLPPRPGVTPATTFVPYSTIWPVWNVASRPVMPCTSSRVSLPTRMLTSCSLRVISVAIVLDLEAGRDLSCEPTATIDHERA